MSNEQNTIGPTLKLFLVTCGERSFVASMDALYKREQMRGLYINGSPLEPSARTDWYEVAGIPQTVQRVRPERHINIRYELRPEYPETDKTPRVASRYDDIEDVHALYERKYDVVEAGFDNMNVECTVIDGPEGFAPVQRLVNPGKVSLLHSLTVPEILHETLPQRLSSAESYKIIREHVKAGLDGRYAKISADYDFSFTVLKYIELDTPTSYQADVSSFRARKARYETRWRKTREVKVLDIIPKVDTSRNYGVLAPAFEGANYEDLQAKVSGYLGELMNTINTPLRDCPHCKGLGVEMVVLQTGKWTAEGVAV